MNGNIQDEKVNAAPSGEKATAPKAAKNPLLDVFETAELFIFSACFVILLFCFAVRPARVIGPSMQDTLYEGETLILCDMFYEPKCGDILVFQLDSSAYPDPIVKRVIATEGQTVDIDYETWTVTVDGVPIDEEYVKRGSGSMYATMSNLLEFPLTVDEGCIFVLGDNRQHSLDSRSKTIGLVSKDNILGQVVFRLLPFSRIGTVN